jgi:hypothetical protein
MDARTRARVSGRTPHHHQQLASTNVWMYVCMCVE